MAKKVKAKSLSIPALSILAENGFAVERVIEIMLTNTVNWLANSLFEEESTIELVRFCNYDSTTTAQFKEYFVKMYRDYDPEYKAKQDEIKKIHE